MVRIVTVPLPSDPEARSNFIDKLLETNDTVTVIRDDMGNYIGTVTGKDLAEIHPVTKLPILYD